MAELFSRRCTKKSTLKGSFFIGADRETLSYNSLSCFGHSVAIFSQCYAIACLLKSNLRPSLKISPPEIFFASCLSFLSLFFNLKTLTSVTRLQFFRRATRLLAQKQPSPVVKNISTGDIFCLRPDPSGRSFGFCMHQKKSTLKGAFFIGADRETRTPDPLITNLAKHLNLLSFKHLYLNVFFFTGKRLQKILLIVNLF